MRRGAVLLAMALAATSCAFDGPTSMGLCVAPELRAALHGGEGAGGHSNAWLVLFNADDRPCVVSGPARLALYDAGGRLVTASEGVSPFIRAGSQSLTGPFRLDARTEPEDFDGPRAGVAWASVAQGACPGGVFPADGRLEIVLADAGRVRVERFEDTLPFDYRCDTAAGPARGVPTLLVSRLSGSKPVERATPRPT